MWGGEMKALSPPLSSASAEACRRVHRALACKSGVSAVQSSQTVPVGLNAGSSTRSKYLVEHATAVHALTEHTDADVIKHTQSRHFQILQSKI